MNPTIKASMYFSAKKKRKEKKEFVLAHGIFSPLKSEKTFSRVHGYSAFPVGKKVTLKKRRTF